MRWPIVDSSRCLALQGGGTLCGNEIAMLLDSLGKRHGQQEMDELMAKLDTDGSGSADFEEFAKWWWLQKTEAHEEHQATTRAAAVESSRNLAAMAQLNGKQRVV